MKCKTISRIPTGIFSIPLTPAAMFNKARREDALIKAFEITVLAIFILMGIAGAAPFAYVTNAGNYINSGTVSVIDIATNNVIATVPVGICPGEVAVTPDGTKVYVANFGIGSTSVSVIDTATNTVNSTANIGGTP